MEYTFELNPFIQYSHEWHGKFVAPSNQWTHMKRRLYEYELFIIMEGELFVGNEKKHYHVQKGQYLIMPPSKNQFGYRPSQCSFFWLHFSPKCNNNSKIFKTIHLPDKGKLQNLERFTTLFTQFNDSWHQHRDYFVMNMLATGILMEVYFQYTKIKDVKLHSRELLNQDIINYISWNHIGNLNVQNIADHFGYHPKYLSSIFHEVSGITLKQYLINVKMEQAKNLLSQTSNKIGNIAIHLGFSDGHNFSHSFKKEVGISPSEYRTNHTRLKINQ